MKRNPNNKQQVRELQKAEPGKAEPGIVAVNNEAAKLSEEDQRVVNALKTMKRSSCVKAESVTDKLLAQAESAILPHWRSKDTTPSQRLELAASLLTEMEPSNVTESMLATQMIAAHDAALIFVHQAARPEATSLEQRDADTERACKFLTLFIQQLDAMQRLKGKTGRQKVIVEHVHVYKGGQAIVGAVTPRGHGEGVGDDSENR